MGRPADDALHAAGAAGALAAHARSGHLQLWDDHVGVLHRPGKPLTTLFKPQPYHCCSGYWTLAWRASSPLARLAECAAVCLFPQVPFQGLTIGQVYSRVVHSGARPPLDAFDAAKERCAEERPALAAYTALLEACWSAQPSSRPLFKQARLLC